MEQSGLNRNQISKISGISNMLLSKIERIEKGGKTTNIKRKTLINIAVSLNMSLEEINTLLIEYGHSELSTSDTPYFLAASENQKVTGILPLFSSLALEWFLIGMEKRLSSIDGASLVYVLDQPSHALKSPAYATFPYEMALSGKKISAVYKDLVESACLHRRKLITEALERGNRISTFICSNCFERYMRGWERYKDTNNEAKYKNFLRDHIQTLIKYIETYSDRYQINLLEKCPRLRYELLYMPIRNRQGKVKNKINTVFFMGRESECNKDMRITIGNEESRFGQGFGDLIGFATDLQSILDFFHKQHQGLAENFVDHRFKDPEKMIKHIQQLMTKNIP
jgi:transcriptional regulator with XRE-family HTH domain